MTRRLLLPLDVLREAVLTEGGTWTPKRAVAVFVVPDRVPNTQRTRRMLDSLVVEGVLAALPDGAYGLTEAALGACEYHWLVTLRWTTADGVLRVVTDDGTYRAAPWQTRAQVVGAVRSRAAAATGAPADAAVVFLTVEPNSLG